MAVTDQHRGTTTPTTDAGQGKYARGARMGPRLQAYRIATALLRPFAGVILDHRSRQGKEDPARRGERYGVAARERPQGRLAWFHAASIGEMNAVLPLLHRTLVEIPDLHILLTTGTRTAADLAARRLPQRALHQFVPLDAVAYVRRFLAHWQPELAVLVESEIWPNLLLETSGAGIPVVLVNARMSEASFGRWERHRAAAGVLFGCFDIVLAQNETYAARFRRLGAGTVVACGNLKADAPPPPVDAALRAELGEALRGRPLWLAASTHAGEDEVVLAAHRLLAKRFPDLCTLVVPRHPDRGPAIRELAAGMGLSGALRSARQSPADGCQIYIADTVGELGTLLALCPVTFVGGSLVDKGGQNPIEPVRLGSAVVSGRHVKNFEDVFEALAAQTAVALVDDAVSLAHAVEALLADGEALRQSCRNARAAVAGMSGALEATAGAIASLLRKELAAREGGKSGAG